MNESGSGYEQDEPASASPRPNLSVRAPVMKQLVVLIESVQDYYYLNSEPRIYVMFMYA